MNEYLLVVAALVLATVAIGLWRILYGPTRVDRMMAAELLGTGGVATVLLIGAATAMPALVDVALILAVLAVFATVAFVKNGTAHVASDPSNRTELP